MTNKPEGSGEILGLSAGIVAAYLMKNHIPGEELPALIATVHQALKSAATEGEQQPAYAIGDLRY